MSSLARCQVMARRLCSQNLAGVYVVGEVFNGDPNYVCPYQNDVSGVMNYPA